MPPADPNAVREGSFTVQQQIEIDAPRERVWRSLCDVQSWWCHYLGLSDDAVRFEFEPRLGGTFRQVWGEGEGAHWGTVTLIKSPEIIRLSGPLGMDTPVSSVYEFALEERGDSTVLKLTHRCVGLIDEKWSNAHDRGWAKLWEHLKAYVERGERVELRGG